MNLQHRIVGGLGGWESMLAQAGVQLGTQYATQALQRSQISGAQEKEIGKQFDARNKQTAAFFGQLLNLPTVSMDQLDQAAQAYSELASIAMQYGAVDYIASQWASEAPRYQAVLSALEGKLPQAAAAAAAAQSRSGSNGSTVGTPTGFDFSLSNPVVLIGLAMGGFLLLKR